MLRWFNKSSKDDTKPWYTIPDANDLPKEEVGDTPLDETQPIAVYDVNVPDMRELLLAEYNRARRAEERYQVQEKRLKNHYETSSENTVLKMMQEESDARLEAAEVRETEVRQELEAVRKELANEVTAKLFLQKTLAENQRNPLGDRVKELQEEVETLHQSALDNQTKFLNYIETVSKAIDDHPNRLSKTFVKELLRTTEY